MARLSTPNTNELDEDQQVVYEAIASGPRGEVVGPLGVWLHRAALADKAQQLGQYCRYDSSLEPRLSELAILVTARIWDAGFEWDSHEPPARAAGLADNIINALAKDKEPEFDQADESVVYRVSRRLNIDRKLSDELYQEAERLLGKERLVDQLKIQT